MFGRLALFQCIGWVPGDNLAYGCSWIRQNSEVLTWWDPNSGESGYVGCLANAAGCDGCVVGQVVPGWMIGRAALGLARSPGRLALFQSIGWVPGDNLAYVAWWLASPGFSVVPRSRVGLGN